MHARVTPYLLLLAFLLPAAAFAQGTVTGRVTDENGMALPGTNVAVIGRSLGTITDSDGVYRLSLPLGAYEVQFSYIGFRTERRNVTITREGPVTLNVQLGPDLLGSDEVVVIGTRRQDRTIIESPVPVDVLGPREIAAQGLTETTQMLQSLVPSYNAPRSSVTDGSDHMRPATLRGLGPDQVLILVNGKRRHTSALVHVNGSVGRGSTGVDLNAIPSGAIERIEVLRDGAAAQYGSDAIAGVINIILKQREGFDAQVSYGQYLSTVERGYTPTEGNRPSDGAATFDFDNSGEPGFNRIGAPEDVTYSDGQSVTAHAGYGLPVGAGSLYLSGQFRYQDKANRAGLDPRQQYYTGYDFSGFGADFNEDSFDRLNHRYGNGEVSDYSGFINFDMPLDNAGMQLYSFGGVSYRDGLSGCFYRRSLDNRTNRELYPDGFLPLINSNILDLSGAVGVKGAVGGWSYDISETVGSNAFQFNITNSHNASQNNGQTTFDAGTLGFAQATTNADFFRTVEIGTAAPMSVAAGAEFRFENYKITEGQANSYLNGGRTVADGPGAGAPSAAGSQCFPGFQPQSTQDETRTNVGVYVDLENNLTSQLLLGLAGRFENYSDFGSTVTGKVTGRFELIEGVAVRGAVATGFRAPSLAQSHFTSIATNFIGGVPFEVGTFPVTSPVARALGAQDLEAEKSFNLSAGLTLQHEVFSLTADVYQIEITDRITFTENFTGPNVQAFLAARGINANGGRFFTNALDTRTRGIDITGRAATTLGQGTARLTLAANFNDTDVTNAVADPNNAFNRFVPAPTELQNLGFNTLAGRNRLADYEVAQPDSKVSAQLNYDLQRVTFMLRGIRYGEVTSVNTGAPDATTGINERDQTYGAKIITDIELGYRAPQGFTLAVGANNLLDVYPDKELKVNSNTGIFPYSGFSPFGFFGRFVYTRLSVTL